MTRLAQIAASKGDLVIVKWVCGIFTERDSNGTLHYLTENVNLWQIAQNAADYDQLNVVKWIMDEPNRTVLLFQLCSRGIDATPPVKINFNKAAAGGHISVLTWLIQHYPEMCNGNEADFTAAENGHLDILHLLLSSPIEKGISLRAVNAAAENGHLNIVKYLAAEGYSADHAMDVAAEDRLLDIVKWLHENTSDSCSTRAMDGAAYNGHLDVVKWLHRNREEGCTDFAMDGAVDQGHLLVVQWLHENRTEGCTTAAMNEAAHSNNVAVLEWLDQNRTEGFTSAAMALALVNGQFEAYQWLFSRGAKLCIATDMNVAAATNFRILWHLYQNNCGAIETLKIALFRSRQLEFAEWAYRYHRDEFELNIAEHLFAD